jgi:uncharacterized membrane protein YecN with MAPEG domain
MSNVVITCIALMGILVFGLGANVTRQRALRGKAGGTQQPTDPADPLLIAIRAHGNAAEYIPMLGVLLVVGSTLTDSWWLDALAVAAVAVRSAHAIGMLTSPTLASYGPFRSVGASGTYLVGIALGITAIAAL